MAPPATSTMKRLLLLLALLLAALPQASAHKASTSYLQLQLQGEQLQGRWDIALRDLDMALGLDSNGDGQLTWGEIRHQQPRITQYALDRLALRADRSPCTLVSRVDLQVADHSDGPYASLGLTGQCPHAPVDLVVDYQLLFDIDTWHRGLLSLEFHGNRSGLFSPQQRTQHFVAHGASAGDVFLRYFLSGLAHVRGGWDHILFLVGMCLPAVLRRHGGHWVAAPDLRRTLTSAASVVTAFTLAHALTLTLAALGWFTVPTRWIESAVAASVMFAGLNNLVPLVQRRLFLLAGAFGLVHGAAIAGGLIELGLPAGARVWALLAFNLGVELAQLIVVLAVIPPSFALRHSRLYRLLAWVPGSALITLIGLLWLVQRAGNIELGVFGP